MFFGPTCITHVCALSDGQEEAFCRAAPSGRDGYSGVFGLRWASVHAA